MSQHRILSPADYRKMPWKNGGGHTHEIAVHPPGATTGAFAWRVSVAEITRDGPFSVFPGVDRTLVLLNGKGLRLLSQGAPVEMHTPYEPVMFSGEAAIDCLLTDGPTRDFNLMVRRDLASGELRVVRDETEAIAPADTYVCYAAAGSTEFLIAGFPPIEVAPEHTLVIHMEPAHGGGLHVYPTSAQSVALVAVIAAPRAAALQ